MSTTPLLDQLKKALASDKIAIVFIEAFLGLITDERKMFLKHLVMKLQLEDLYMLLQKVNQRIQEPKENNGTMGTEELVKSVCVKVEDEESGEHDDIIIDVDPSPLQGDDEDQHENNLDPLFEDVHKNSEPKATKGARSEKSFQCTVCLKPHTNKEALRRHSEMHREAIFKCDFCELKYNKAYRLKIHRRIHTGEKPYQCDQCERTFHSSNSRRAHEIREHIDKAGGPYHCDLCPKKMFTTTIELKTHIQRQHVNKVEIVKRDISCKECSKKFCNASDLEEHMRKHTGDRPYTCSICPNAFISQRAVKVHELWHQKNTALINMMCEHCSKICTTRDQWNYHLKTHVSHQFKCDQCPNRTFSTMVTLKTHKRIHTKEKPYQCDECPKTFSHTNTLQLHKRIHSGIKPFSCDFCEKKFFDQTGLRKHTRTHTGEKPYHCDSCDKSFRQRSTFNTHLKTHGVLNSRLTHVQQTLNI